MTNLERITRDLLFDLRILAGDEVGPSDVSWQDVAGTCACNAQALASLLERYRSGESGGASILAASIGAAFDNADL